MLQRLHRVLLCLLLAFGAGFTLFACGGGGGGSANSQAPTLAIVANELPPAQAGVTYFTQLSATNATGAISWSIDASSVGSLPSGLSLDRDSGQINGIPTITNSQTVSITVIAADDTYETSHSFSLELRAAGFASNSLNSLAIAGGGVGGAPISPGAPIYAKATSALDGSPLSGIRVFLNSDDGGLVQDGVTDVTGEVVLFSSSQLPTLITFHDPTSGDFQSFYGNELNPLREFVGASFARSPDPVDLEVQISGLPVGEDLRVRVNGTIVNFTQGVGESATASVPSTVLLPLLDGDRAQPWLMIVEVFAAGTTDLTGQGDLMSASYIVDSDGFSASDIAVVLNLDHSAGTGSAGDGVSTGLCTVETVSGTITVPTPNILGGSIALPRLAVSIENGFGSWEDSTLPFDLQNLPTSISLPYSIAYPQLPGSVIGGPMESITRMVQLVVADSSTLTQLLQDPTQIGNDLSALLDIPVVFRRHVEAGSISDLNISLGDLTSGLLTVITTNHAHYDVQLDAFTGGALNALSAALVSQIDSDTFFLSAGAGTTSQIQMATVGNSASGIATTTSWLAPIPVDLATSDSGLTGGQVVVRRPLTLANSTSGGGDTGSVASPVTVDARVAGGTALDATLSTSATAGIFDIDAHDIRWTGGGLTKGNGFFQLDLNATGAAAESVSWSLFVPNAASSSATSSDYVLRLPVLPAVISDAGIRAEHEALTISLTYIDVAGEQLDVNSLTFDQVADAFPIDLLNLDLSVNDQFLPDRLVSVPDFFSIVYASPTVVDPE